MPARTRAVRQQSDLDVVFDTLGGEVARRSIGVMRPGGMLVTVVGRRDADLAARTEAAKAHELMESGRTVGKIVLTL